MRILYIAGYGRSGSTVLATVLGAHPDLASAGELAFALDEFSDPARTCSCGQAYRACEFWAPLAADPALAAARAPAIRATERVTSLAWIGRAGGRARGEVYRTTQRRIVQHIATRSGATVIVDSSKSARGAAWRALALRRLAGYDVFVLHLVRDGRAVMRSLLQTGSNRRLEGSAGRHPRSALRAAAGWTRGNLCAESMRLFDRGRYMRLRLEDFLAEPAASLRRIAAFVGVDAQPLLERLRRDGGFAVGHVVSGNRVRFRGEIRLRRRIDEPPALSPWQRAAFGCVGGWLNRLYGYGAR